MTTLPQEAMVSRVARALGPDLVGEVAFVGGCATALLVTDEAVRAGVRFTDDVDVIVHVLGYGQWHQLEKQLAQRNFVSSADDDFQCRKRLRDKIGQELIVDFMPDDEKILGFSNRWYREALETAAEHQLTDGVVVRLVIAPYFLATKLEAFKGRGNNDPMGSRDVEDIINLVAGRDALPGEMSGLAVEFQQALARELWALMEHRDFDYAVASACNGSPSRERQLFDRFEALARLR